MLLTHEVVSAFDAGLLLALGRAGDSYGHFVPLVLDWPREREALSSANADAPGVHRPGQLTGLLPSGIHHLVLSWKEYRTDNIESLWDGGVRVIGSRCGGPGYKSHTKPLG